MSTFIDGLDLTSVSVKGWELAQILKRAPHKPRNKQELLESLADRAVVLHGAGTQSAVLSIFETDATPAAVEASIGALV